MRTSWMPNSKPKQPLLVADSGPLIALAGIKQLQLLQNLFSCVMIPVSVSKEVVNQASFRVGHDLFQQAPWIKVMEPPRTTEILLLALGRGETDAITLALQQHATILMDERRARKAAQSLNLSVVGTAGILVKAKRNRLIPDVSPLLLAMQKNGYWLGDKIIQKACEAVGEKICGV